MAKPNSGGSGSATVPASDVESMLRQATGLPSTFFITMTKAKVQADGSLQANYTFSTEGAPPPPALADEQPLAKETPPDGNI